MNADSQNGFHLVREYDLPDAALLRPSGEAARCLVWRPDRTVVVIGRGSDPALEVRLAEAEADGVHILQRGTGGCAVVLSPEMVAASFVVRQAEQRHSREYFRMFNAMIMDALARQGIEGLEQRGISDIALHGRKVAGTAIYRNRELVFFHAIINSAGSTAAMERYLRTPPRMPEYRVGRPHATFVTSLVEHGFVLDVKRFADDLQAAFAAAGAAP